MIYSDNSIVLLPADKALKRRNDNSDDSSKSVVQLQQEFIIKPGPKKELLRICLDKDKKNSASSKGKMTESSKTNNKLAKKDSKRTGFATNSQSSYKKQNRKGENPVRLSLCPEKILDNGCLNSWICKNSACKAVLSMDDTFCKRCSCCICHLFDDNKDPSLWLVCSSESGQPDFCGLSCHIECALQRKKVGVVDLGQLMQLDGSYCCTSCGKVSGILGCWKKQLVIAKEARRVDILCYRIHLSYRLLEGSSRFKELHEIVENAKEKLETDVGPVNGVSTKMARGIVSRLSVAGDVQKLCTLGIEKADEWLTSISNVSSREDSLPVACKFIFEEVTPSSVVIILIDLSKESSNDIKGYKLWYCKSREEEIHTKVPVSVFPRTQRRILISNLQPCTEYTFRIISCTDAGDLGHSETKCFTKSVEILHKNHGSIVSMKDNQNDDTHYSSKNDPSMPAGEASGFKIQELGKILRFAWQQEEGCSGVEKCCELSKEIKPEKVPRGLDLNVASVPDLNEELVPPFESSGDEENGSQTWARGQKRLVSSNEELHDSDSTLVNWSPLGTDSSGCLDENFEYCVKIVRWLECEGHLKHDFRLKLLTWFSLRSTEQERRVVNAFVHTLIDDPSSLAGQLVDSFSDIISNKRTKSGIFCSKLGI